MIIHLNKSAEIITIHDLPQRAFLEIRDLTGRLIRSVLTVTPTYTMDSENWLNGLYMITAVHDEQIQTLQLQIKH